MKYDKPSQVNALVLAYLGDAYFELLVREYLINETVISKPNDFQKNAVKLVSATSQQEFVMKAIEQNWINEEEILIYKRGRNTKSGTKNESSAHRHSTGFEAIIGQYYLENKFDRIQEIFTLYKNYFYETKTEQI